MLFTFAVVLLYILFYPVAPRPWHYMKNEPANSTQIMTKSLCNIGKVTYFVVMKLMDWPEASDACKKFCSTLATFSDMATLKKVVDSLGNQNMKDKHLPPDYFKQMSGTYEFPRDRRYWIGLNDLGREGVWTWNGSNSTLKIDAWYTNQPDHQRNKGYHTPEGSEHCVTLWNPVFHKDGQEHSFNDEPCNMTYYALCNPYNHDAALNEPKIFETPSVCRTPSVVGCGTA